MSRIDDLIAEHCPDGVEYRPLGEVIENLRTGLNPRQNFKLNTTDARHKYITVRELAGFSLLPTEKTDLINDEGLARIQARSKLKLGDVLFSGTGTIGRTALVEEVPSTWNIKEGVYALTPKSEVVNPRYLIYTLHSTAVHNRILASADGSTVASVSMTTLRGVKIPVPPLEVQRAIVEILDNFTALEAELEAELEARKKQYEYYRRTLLKVDENVEWSTLGDVSLKVSSGGTPTKSIKRYYQDGNIPWLRTQEVKFSEVWKTKEFITEEAVKETSAKWIPKDCLIVAISGASAGRVAINKIPLTTNQHCCNLQINGKRVNYRFAFHWVSSNYQELKSLGRGARADLNSKIIQSFPIPIPSLEEQNRIVEILDKFDALVNDLSSGLPAEITARRKQYEYYRNQLLTFKELAS